MRDAPPTPDGNTLADYVGEIGDPRELARRFSETPGVVEHGLFEPELVDVILVARGTSVEERAGGRRRVRS
jgi:ribose 5-phosphate isomerase A